MNLKEDIDNLFNKNTGYAEPEQAINQAKSLTALSVDLYTDPKRFMYELLQNADDSSMSGDSIKIGVRIFGDFLVVSHTGKPFDKRDIRGICGVSDGTKKSATEKTGYKGIGFKAVFGQSDKVIVYTDGEYFRFDSEYNFLWNPKWGDSQDRWESENERKFQYPWQIIPIYTKAEELDGEITNFLNEGEWTVATIIFLSKGQRNVREAIEELSSNINMFLFLRNVDMLDFNLETSTTLTFDREQGGSFVKVKKNGKVEASWLLRTAKLVVPNEVKLSLTEERNVPDKLLNANCTELTLAAKVDENGIRRLSPDERLLYSYLPTEESKYAIPVLVNSSFVVGANRQALHEDSKWNQWLFYNIPLELLKWVSELVKGSFVYQAYELIPSVIQQNSLGVHYRDGRLKAIATIPFILSNKRELLLVGSAVIDLTSISSQNFIGEDVVREFVAKKFDLAKIITSPFSLCLKYERVLKDIGVAYFEWQDVPKLLKSKFFLKDHTVSKNIELIKYVKVICEDENLYGISDAVVKNWPFVLDHKGNMHRTSQVYFPTSDDATWNNPSNDISFLEEGVQAFLLGNPEMRIWTEKLGITEKTDLTFLRKTIIENASTYCNSSNSVETILTIFSIYLKGEIGKEDLVQLSELKVLTRKGSMLPVSLCYFSDSYSPRLKLESVLKEDVFVSDVYLTNRTDRDEWRRFFKMMGVKEGVTITSFGKTNKETLIEDCSFKREFFIEDDKFFQPQVTNFNASEYSNLMTLNFLSNASDFTFSRLFWSDLIENTEVEKFNAPATAYWGRFGHLGRSKGNTVANYMTWYVNNFECIPTSMECCSNSKEVFLNSESIVKLAGKYLPVFSGDELPQDYRSFFKFKTNLRIIDYLNILSNLSIDVTEKGQAKKFNLERIQSIYKILLDSCANWSEEEALQLKEWANEGVLLGSDLQFRTCTNLKFFLDGNESVFQNQFYFLLLDSDNRNHPYLQVFLNIIGVTVMMQSDFEIIHTEKEPCPNLSARLNTIVPFLKVWIKSELSIYDTGEYLEYLEPDIQKLSIYQCQDLKIRHSAIGFEKSVNVHFDQTSVYVTKPWSTNAVLLKLPELLCRYLRVIGQETKLGFLLRSSNEEILEYFKQESISVSDEILNLFNLKVNEGKRSNSFLEISNKIDQGVLSPDFFHLSKSDYAKLRYVESIIKRSVSNIVKYLSAHPDYDLDNHYSIASSIIGGVVKNGNEITVVARPSDGDEVLLYYTSEFDVLEYVDAEFWCEDGVKAPRQITLGQLLKKTGINRIPVIGVDASNYEWVASNSKSDTLDFNAVPYVPHKIAKIVSSFANTKGGLLIFGVREINMYSNEIVGISNDFRVGEVVKKAISLLSPIPEIKHGWILHNEKRLFAIEIEESNVDVELEGQKYVREGVVTKILKKQENHQVVLNSPSFSKTVAIVIGIENYLPRNEISPVKYAVSDAQKFKQMLIECMGVEEEDIHTFENDAALKSTLEYDLKGLFHYLTKDDRLIFYYVGHGFHNGLTNYLSTYDMHKYSISETGVSLRKILIDPLRSSKCNNALIFIDSCAKISIMKMSEAK